MGIYLESCEIRISIILRPIFFAAVRAHKYKDLIIKIKITL